MKTDAFFVPTQLLSFNPSNNRIFVRRDDLYPVAFGGNKARKAELYFSDLLSKKVDTVVTYGSSSSNHCRAVACFAAKYNVDCILVSPSEQSEETSNRKLCEIFGAQTVECPMSDVSATIDNVLEKLRNEGKNPYFIYGGGHGNPGTLAYRMVFDEIVEYESRNDVEFDYIFHASGTGTTQAGLVAGKLETGSNVKIVGISIARQNPRGRDVILRSLCDFLEPKYEYDYDAAVEFTDEYTLGGYGKTCPEQLMLMEQMLLEEGLPLDHTYTGKAFWGMTEYIKKHDIFGKNILFIHTGGTPLFYDDLENMRK